MTQLLKTKLYPPTAPDDLLARVRVSEHLDRGCRHRLSLVSAPAGYGKSTAVVQWLQSREEPTAWLSLDAEDSNVRVFLEYVVAAVRTAYPAACPETLSLLQTATLPPVSVLAATVVNEVDALDEPLFLVLDDYHCIAEPAVHELVDQVLRHPPLLLHLVLATRRDPPLSLVALRAKGQMTDVRLQDLQFTGPETAAFLEHAVGVSLSAAALVNLQRVVEGWPVGLRLIALALRHHDDADGYLVGLTGGPQQVQEYLVEEVISTQPPGMRDWLLETSILDRFCAELCEAVCVGEDKLEEPEMDGRAFLSLLQQSGLFTIPLDPAHVWLRYHHLFQSLLRQRLGRHHDRDAIAALHARASGWLEEHGLIDEAIQHALAAGDVDGAADLVEQNEVAAMNGDRWQHLERWLAMVPEAIRQQRPILLMAQAWICLQSTRLSELHPLIERAQSLIGDDSVEPTLSAEMNLFRGIVCYFENEKARCLECFTKAAKLVANRPGGALAGEIEYWFAVALHLDGQKDVAIRTLRNGIGKRGSEQGAAAVRLIFGLCFIHMLEGDWVLASERGLQMREVARSNALDYAETWAIIVLANAALQRCDMEVARHYFELAEEKRYLENARAAVDAMAGSVITAQLTGDSSQADGKLRLALEFAEGTDDPRNVEIVFSCQARLALLRGDVASAVRWRRSLSRLPDASTMLFFIENPCLTECRVLVAEASEASSREAEDRLQRLWEAASAFHNRCQMVEITILRSLAIHRQGRSDEALKILEQAVAIAEPGRSIRPFLELGAPMADLLRQLREQSAAADYIGTLLAAFDAEATRPVPAAPASRSARSSSSVERAVIESLTNREVEVLELLSQRLYNKEIAVQLSVSADTVKTHLKHTYGKLGVSTRRQAIVRAEELGVLKNN